MGVKAGSDPILLLQGPTGSGKSALALALAESLDAAIVNADALQVYADWRVLSARPADADMAHAPHHLFGCVDAVERYSVGRWLQDVLDIIRASRANERRIILVGGTGLYFRALTQGLAEIPAVPEGVRAELIDRLAKDGPAALYMELQGVDSDCAARIKPTDSSRIVRALSVYEAFGETITSLQAKTSPPLGDARFCRLALTPPRAVLYQNINARFGQMIAKGALDEARALLARGLPEDLPAMKAVGAPPLFAHLRGEISLDEAIALGARDTRRYAKRQFTWVANQTAGWTKIETLDPVQRIEAALAAFENGRTDD